MSPREPACPLIHPVQKTGATSVVRWIRQRFPDEDGVISPMAPDLTDADSVAR